MSVASAVEPAGANCADGGSKFTAANGVTYACNGADGESGTGTGAAASCPDVTLNGGTNGVFGGDRAYSRIEEQFTPRTSPPETTFLCAGIISDFQVTVSGDVGGIIDGYEVFLKIRDQGSIGIVGQCKFGIGGTSALTCANLGVSAEINPGAEVYVEVNGISAPTPQSFDWSAVLAPPSHVYP